MHTTRSCDAIDSKTFAGLQVRLQKRADKDGPWWGGEAT